MKKKAEDMVDTFNSGIDECCSIAESMIDEIHHISVLEGMVSSDKGRHKGSLKRMIIKQIKQARKLSW